MRAAPALLLALPLLAGCLGLGDVEPDDDVVPPARPPFPSALHLNGAGQLLPEKPTGDAPERLNVGSFYQAWTLGDDQPTWTGDAVWADALATEASLTFYYTADPAVATTGPQDQGFPEFVVYFGVEGAPMAWASVSGPDVVTQDDVVDVTVDLEVPTGGLALPAGLRPVVKIAPVQGQTDDNPIVILVNATTTPSAAHLTLDEVAYAAAEEESVLDETGTLFGSAYALDAVDGVTSAAFPLEVPGHAIGLRIAMQRGTGVGVADIDLAVMGPDGGLVAQSVTPEPREGILLREPNLEAAGPGTYTVRVTNYGNAQTTFDLQAWLLHPAG